jgi:uncharacterized protein YecE (DUF72 family)
MHSHLSVGCCGWSYLRPREFQKELKRPYISTLQAYAQLFNVVEVNTTFYRIPGLSTAQKWREESMALNGSFRFTVKAYQGITHRDRFGRRSPQLFDALRKVAQEMNASVILFQLPGSFHPDDNNIRKLKEFFTHVERGAFAFAWEPRGRWLENPHAITDVCEECDLVHCVDPLRSPSLWSGKAGIAYFRVHGFGERSIYRYNFSETELQTLHSLVQSLKTSRRGIYVFFNNVFCYRNALSFSAMLDGT